MKKLILTIICLLLCGCATPFAKFYSDQTGGLDVTKLPTVVISNEDPKIFKGSDVEKDVLYMLENGYTMVGYSSFNSGNVKSDGALTQAKKVHASVVVIYSQLTDTISGFLPLTVPDTQRSTTSLSGSTYGYGGFTTFSGNMHTTTYGTRTMYFPYSVNRYDYLATYWVKLKPPIFGVHAQELTPELRQRIGSNKGVFVYAVIKGSPAYDADILQGDIIKRIGGTEVNDMESFQKILAEHAGQKVMVEFLRGSKFGQKEVHLIPQGNITQESSIGYVNIQKVLNECDAGKMSKNLLQQLASKFEADIKRSNQDQAELFAKYRSSLHELKARVEELIIEGIRRTAEKISKEDGYEGIYDIAHYQNIITWEIVENIPQDGEDITAKVIAGINMEKTYLDEIKTIVDEATKASLAD